MFSPDNLYHYLRHIYNWPKKPYVIKTMHPHGSKEIPNLITLGSLFNIPHPHIFPPVKFLGNCIILDQEPISLDDMQYSLTTYKHTHDGFTEEMVNKDSLLFRMYDTASDQLHPLYLLNSALYPPIVAHSELNSIDVLRMKKNHYIDVHYWAHGIFSLNWFGKYKYLEKSSTSSAKRMGVYIRDASGSRTYRTTLLTQLSSINHNVYYKFQPLISEYFRKNNQYDILAKWGHADVGANSNASAEISWKDHTLFDIQIVTETLFDTEKTHLTEKTLKPMIMYQPFIMFAGPYSLQYIKKYGFKTFGHLWDESYDTECDPVLRFNQVMDVIHYLSNLSQSKFNALMAKTTPIVMHNRNHFFNNQFELHLMDELHRNFENAFRIQNEQFSNFPGGTLFFNYNILYNESKEIPLVEKERIHHIMKYLEINYPTVRKNILSEYKGLFSRL
jgi:hypothetical protein